MAISTTGASAQTARQDRLGAGKKIFTDFFGKSSKYPSASLLDQRENSLVYVLFVFL